MQLLQGSCYPSLAGIMHTGPKRLCRVCSRSHSYHCPPAAQQDEGHAWVSETCDLLMGTPIKAQLQRLAPLNSRSHLLICMCRQALQRAAMLPTSGIASCSANGRARLLRGCEQSQGRHTQLRSWAASNPALLEAMYGRIRGMLGQ